MKKYIISLVVNLFALSVCDAQVKPLGEAPLNLEIISFQTKISTLYPDKNKSKEYENSYEIKGSKHSQIVAKETAFENEYSENKKAVGIEYLQKSSTSIDTIALFGKQNFQKVNVATTLDGKIKVVNGVADFLTKDQAKKLTQELINKYGTPTKLRCRWNENFTLLEWILKNKIVRYVSAIDDESTSMKIIIDEEKKSFKSGEKEPHFVGYLFIINPMYKDQVFRKAKTGDFVFLDEKK